jgi:hypothetical protein
LAGNAVEDHCAVRAGEQRPTGDGARVVAACRLPVDDGRREGLERFRQLHCQRARRDHVVRGGETHAQRLGVANAQRIRGQGHEQLHGNTARKSDAETAAGAEVQHSGGVRERGSDPGIARVEDAVGIGIAPQVATSDLRVRIGGGAEGSGRGVQQAERHERVGGGAAGLERETEDGEARRAARYRCRRARDVHLGHFENARRAHDHAVGVLPAQVFGAAAARAEDETRGGKRTPQGSALARRLGDVGDDAHFETPARDEQLEAVCRPALAAGVANCDSTSIQRSGGVPSP